MSTVRRQFTTHSMYTWYHNVLVVNCPTTFHLSQYVYLVSQWRNGQLSDDS